MVLFACHGSLLGKRWLLISWFILFRRVEPGQGETEFSVVARCEIREDTTQNEHAQCTE